MSYYNTDDLYRKLETVQTQIRELRRDVSDLHRLVSTQLAEPTLGDHNGR
jgi:hypothetical protein